MLAPTTPETNSTAPLLRPRIRVPGTEARIHHRREVGMELFLTDLRGETVLRCRCTNISAGGLLAYAPVLFGVGVGKRYELRLQPTDGRASVLLGDSLGYATVIRTQFQRVGDEDMQAIALRFDVPQYLPV